MSEVEFATLLADVARRAGGLTFLALSGLRIGEAMSYGQHVWAQDEGRCATAITLRPSSPSKRFAARPTCRPS